MKECTKCKETKEYTEFHKNRCRKDGYQYWCKDCYVLYQKRWKANNKDKANEYQKSYFKKRYAEDPEFRQKNKESCKNYRKNNQEKVKKYGKAYYHERKQLMCMAEEAAKYREQGWNALKHCIRNENYRAWRYFDRPKEEVFTFDEVMEALILPFGYLCFRCFDSLDVQLDHIVSLNNEGQNIIDNIQFLCGECNRLKGSRTYDFRGNDVPVKKLDF